MINFSAGVNITVLSLSLSSPSVFGGLMLFPGESNNSYNNTYATDSFILTVFGGSFRSLLLQSSSSSSSSSSSFSSPSSSTSFSSSPTTFSVILTSFISTFSSGKTFTVSQTIACVADGKSIFLASRVRLFIDVPCRFSRAARSSLERTRAACARHLRT